MATTTLPCSTILLPRLPDGRRNNRPVIGADTNVEAMRAKAPWPIWTTSPRARVKSCLLQQVDRGLENGVILGMVDFGETRSHQQRGREVLAEPRHVGGEGAQPLWSRLSALRREWLRALFRWTLDRDGAARLRGHAAAGLVDHRDSLPTYTELARAYPRAAQPDALRLLQRRPGYRRLGRQGPGRALCALVRGRRRSTRSCGRTVRATTSPTPTAQRSRTRRARS